MPQLTDAHGLPITGSSQDTADRLDRVVGAYLEVRADTRDRLAELLRDDPQCGLGHCLDGYLSMLSSQPESTEAARSRAALAHRASRADPLNERELLHLAALESWSSGDLPGAVARWDAVLASWPRDILAIRVSQFVLSYLGLSQRMRDTTAGVLGAWSPEVPGYGYLLGCHAYALEEAGEYRRAEELGRQAVAENPRDIWAAHAVAHVREMEGRLREGVEWIKTLSGHWSECTNFALHLRWHEGLFHLEMDDPGRVLEVYDQEVRKNANDQYLDVSNAVSLLWRLEQADVNVGDRWRPLADAARAHLNDHALVFADLHYLMAVAAVDDRPAVEGWLESAERFAGEGGSTEATVMAGVGLPLARAIVAHRRGDYAAVVDLAHGLMGRFREIGGSHAQRDLFDQLVIDAAWRAGRWDVAEELLARRTARRPRNRWGWRHYAAVLDQLGRAGARDAHRAADRLRQTD